MAERGGAGNEGLESWAIVLIILGVLLYFLINHFFWVYVTAWKWLRFVQLSTLSYLVPDSLQAWSGFDFNGGRDFILETEPKKMTAKLVGAFDNIYLRFINWLPGVLIFFYGFKLFMDSSSNTSKHTMESMLLKMSHAFPHNKKFIGINPELTPIDFYPDDPSSYEFSLSMTERQFAEIVPPLGLEKLAKRNPKYRRPIWNGKKGFNEELARKSFEAQMGPLYRGYRHMSEDERVLFDLFKEKQLVKRASVIPVIKYYLDEIMNQRSKDKAFSHPGKKQRAEAARKLADIKIKYMEDLGSHKALAKKLQMFVEENLIEHGSSWQIKDVIIRGIAGNRDFVDLLRHVLADQVMSRHAFTYTGLISLLEAAGEGSTFAPSSLRWLKGRNRTLWYALNCVGKKVAFTESAGPFAHWLLEKEAGIPIPHPEVTEAIEALRVALNLKSSRDQDEFDNWDT